MNAPTLIVIIILMLICLMIIMGRLMSDMLMGIKRQS